MRKTIIVFFSLFVVLILLLSQLNNIEQLYFEHSMKLPLTFVNRDKMTLVDKETRFDSAILSAHKTIEYNYTFVNRDISSIKTPEIKEKIYNLLYTNVKNDPSFGLIRDKNANIAFLYRDRRGTKVFRFIIKPKEYEQP